MGMRVWAGAGQTAKKPNRTYNYKFQVLAELEHTYSNRCSSL